jgi:hypothetical protein
MEWNNDGEEDLPQSSQFHLSDTALLPPRIVWPGNAWTKETARERRANAKSRRFIVNVVDVVVVKNGLQHKLTMDESKASVAKPQAELGSRVTPLP